MLRRALRSGPELTGEERRRFEALLEVPPEISVSMTPVHEGPGADRAPPAGGGGRPGEAERNLNRQPALVPTGWHPSTCPQDGQRQRNPPNQSWLSRWRTVEALKRLPQPGQA